MYILEQTYRIIDPTYPTVMVPEWMRKYQGQWMGFTTNLFPAKHHPIQFGHFNERDMAYEFRHDTVHSVLFEIVGSELGDDYRLVAFVVYWRGGCYECFAYELNPQQAEALWVELKFHFGQKPKPYGRKT